MYMYKSDLNSKEKTQRLLRKKNIKAIDKEKNLRPRQRGGFVSTEFEGPIHFH